MATADVKIKIVGSYNGNAVEKARQSLEKLNAQSAMLGNAGAAGLTRWGTALLQDGAELENIGYKLEQTGKRGMNFSAAMVAAGYVTVQKAVEIDTALTGVRKTVDATDEEYQALKQSAIEFSKTNAIEAKDILAAEELGGQLGVAKENLEEFAHITTGLDIATNMDVETASTELARFANITKMAADEYGSYGNTIVGLGNSLATTESEISALSLRMASAGTQAGMSRADIMGMAGALSSLGVEAQAGGSAFSKTISTIQVAVATGSEDLAAYAEVAGMSADEFARAWGEDATGAFIKFIEGLANGRGVGEDMNVILEELDITELRQSDTLRRLAGNTDLLTRAVGLANEEWENGSALTDEVANKNDSLAAKFQMLENRSTAVAEKVGVPLANALLQAVDAAEPLFNIIEDGANAFAEMDEDGQRVIVTIAGIATAFAPALVIGGKYVSMVGRMMKAIGAQGRGLGQLINLHKTDNAELLRRTAAEGTFCQKLMVATNQTAKATAQTKAATSVAKSATASVSGYGMKVKDYSNVQKVATSSTKASTLAIQGQTVASKAGAMAARGLGLAIKTVAPIAALTIGVELIGRIAGAISDAAEHAENYESATKKLSGAHSEFYSALRNGASALATTESATESYSQSLGDVQAEVSDVLSANAELASSLTDIYTQAGTSVGSLNTYAHTIDSLAGRSNLTAEQVARLELAVSKVNEACGTQYSVVQDAGGAYQVMAGGAEQAKDAVLDVINAQKMQIQLEANNKAWGEAYEKQAAAAKASADAHAQLEAAQKAVDEMSIESCGSAEAYNYALQAAVWQLDQAKKTAEEADGALESCDSAMKQASDSATLMQMALDAEADSATRAVANNLNLTSAFDTAGKSSLDFVSDLEAVGASAAALAELTPGQAASIASAYNGTYTSIQSLLQEYGVTVDETAAKEKLAIEEAQSALNNFSAAASPAIESLKGSISGGLQSVAEACRNEGIQIPQSIADAINGSANLPADAQRVMMDALVIQMTGGDVKAAAEILGHDIDEGLKAGIEGSSDLPSSAVGIMSEDVINKAKEAFQSHSPSQVMIQLGTDIDTGLSQGIDGSASLPTTSMNTLSLSMQQEIGVLPGYASTTGSDTGMSLSSSLGSWAGAVQISASGLATSAEMGVSGLPTSASLTGTSAGSALASSLGGAASLVSGAANTLSNSAKVSVSGIPTAAGNAGSTAGSQMASGLSRNAGAVSGAARWLASSAENGIKTSRARFGQEGDQAARAFATRLAAFPAQSYGQRLGNSAMSGLRSTVQSARSAGYDFATGYGNGINSRSSWVYSVAYNLAKQAVAAAKAAQNSASPSKVTRALGRDFGAGYGLGIKDEYGFAASSAAGLSESAIGNLGDDDVKRMYIPMYENANGGAYPGISGGALGCGNVYYTNIYIDGKRVDSGISSGMDDAIGQVIAEAERYYNMGVGCGY